MMRNTSSSWGWVSRIIHWLMAGLIAGQVVLGKYAEDLDRSAQKLNLMMWHKSLGIVLLLLVVVRLAWLLANPRPAVAAPAFAWQKWAARVSHASLYALMFAVPLSGWLMNSAKNVPFSLFRTIPWPNLIGPDKGLGELFQRCHELLGDALIAILLIHVIAAFWHHFHRGDEVLRNMLGAPKT